MKSLKFIFLIVLGMLLSGLGLMANEIAISNLSLTGKNTTDHFTLVKFDITWENSWRTTSLPGNWDAAWVFVKYRVGGGDWQHAWLNESGHTAPAGSTITPGLLTPGTAFNATTNPGLGAFIYRSVDGTGTFSSTGVQLRWNYGANGLTDADADVVEIRAFAIEMVYVPQGSFYVGSGGTESGSLTNGSWASGPTVPLLIASESALTIGHSTGNLWGTSSSGDNTIGVAGTLAAAFPKGYGAFFCMKYEMSQQQYVDFLNTITSTQAANRYSSGSTGYRYGITVSGGVYSTTNPYVACNWLSWMDGAAYTDWAGLRPMTELEFEKACRGTATPVAGEYAWGNTTATAANNITNGGANNETTNTPNANAVYLFLSGPMRTGVFATGSTTRAQAGATYYGIMEMSGNLWERPVTIGSATGRDFTGVHGNGTLSTAGYADISTCHGFITTEVTTATGSGLRGGSFTDNYMNISNRELGSLEWSDRFQNDGFRAVRTQHFLCGTSTVSDIDNNTYNTVLIGEQCWMKENLKVTKNPAGNAITRYCNPNDPEYCDTYGGLYTWDVMMNGAASSNTRPSGVQGICPTGWHIPGDEEWIQLRDALGGESVAGGKMKETGTSHWKSENVGATNSSGFTGLPSGYCNTYGTCYDIGNSGNFWSSSEYTTAKAWNRCLLHGTAYLRRFEDGKDWGLSVRCVRD